MDPETGQSTKGGKAVEANDTTSAKALMPKILNIKDTFKALTPSEYERRLGDL